MSVGRALSGTGGLVDSCSPICSRLAKQTVSGPSNWFVPVMTTEASPRLMSFTDTRGAIQHVVIWDERHAQYLTRLVETHEACMRVKPDFESAVGAFSAISRDFVLEQLNPHNRHVRLANDPKRADRVLARTFSHCANLRAADDRTLKNLLDSPEMKVPEVKNLLRFTLQCCRELTLDHEVHHYCRRHSSDWIAWTGKSIQEMETQVLDLLSGYEGATISNIRLPGRCWSFFETLLNQVPALFLRKKFEHTRLGEEIQSDLVPLLMFCSGARSDALRAHCTEAQEFSVISRCYQAGQVWQIATAYLEGLRIEVLKALGRGARLTSFADSDLGLRLMLGNFICYAALTEPPYAPNTLSTFNSIEEFHANIENTRNMAKDMPKMRGSDENTIPHMHRALFLEKYELSNHTWLRLLNVAGLEISDMLTAAAEPQGTIPPLPNFESYLNSLGIYNGMNRTNSPT